MTRPVRIMKFGGTSLGDEARVAKAAELVAKAASVRVIAVVSALGGVTTSLSDLADRSARGNDGWAEGLRALADRHVEIADAVALPGERTKVEGRIVGLFHDLETVLSGIHRVRDCSAKCRDYVLSFGERASSAILSAALRAAGVESSDHDARRFILTDSSFGEARVLPGETEDRVREYFASLLDGVAVVTGFIGSTADGETTTLGRNSSDLTAALLAAALQAESLELWTDVDGIMSADPRVVPDALPVPAIGYQYVSDLLRAGAKVVYPHTIQAVVALSIPVRVRNTLNPDFPGTLIGADAPPDRPFLGVASSRGLAVIDIALADETDPERSERRIRDALGLTGVPITFLARHEASRYSVVTQEELAARARSDLADAFLGEVAVGSARIDKRIPLACIVTLVAGSRPIGPESLVEAREVLTHLDISTLAHHVDAKTLHMVIPAEREHEGVRALHTRFLHEEVGEGGIFLCGAGNVGRRLVQLLPDRELRLRGIANSRASLSVNGRDPLGALDALEHATDPSAGLFEELTRRRDQILIDCTSSPDVASRYAEVLATGTSIVTANKLLLSGDITEYAEAFEAARRGGSRLLYAATVGAGLPVLSSIRALHAAGDRVLSVEGCMSGTLSFVAEELMAGAPFSTAVRKAHELGLTEPDPRADLSGLDVARKVVVLARESGRPLSIEDVHVEGLVSEEMAQSTLDDFWAELPSADDAMAARVAELLEPGTRLVYLGSFDDGGARVGFQAVPVGHAAHSLRPSENVFICTTEAYREAPLVVRGPGAGPHVTAIGLLTDVMKIRDVRS